MNMSLLNNAFMVYKTLFAIVTAISSWPSAGSAAAPLKNICDTNIGYHKKRAVLDVV